ncbi:CUGBP Elav-like family member 5 [Amphibalanus amphitrite]|uniref:CUGBP Elav-like family member 5 n=1 Tax=Amphibalanus amphitrite TaxID=1232801 RepID=UPI001C9110F7|nr:CUGBP Elav-like family member 5 [Amphibalanus amphitrite]XP_043225775.1 CUGBP Elav-like family member 5 [Amphibalanus amphitrite]XP_043225776.1 CUGBP Elav-like family member 5 [Amphibalanus amphitrite]XP_043225777.1 CUGBP Elav-like family member 5 [Amphibalanus amphitrite]XP_043225779.1 CUGBP Elav-like family member 5 [Amphibalanus amphitrite]XP_043225780.1 CUGBP Elav-like family member 5 [Amphibalanus amphitrite]XP_043225781.1 CUGBP Elav-like family member 5 [Amphibalanus amphitrite]XP_0
MSTEAGDTKSWDGQPPEADSEAKPPVAMTGVVASGDSGPSANGDSAAKRINLGHPDPDSMKMFAGQIPRHMEEPELRKVFEEFGPVYELSILKDRATGGSRGCCFVTFMKRKDALEAQNKLHGVRVLPTMHNPVQMKPADVEPRSERKLFVGMIGKETGDETVRSMFMSYGPIEECTVLRDAQKNSKGCAFVTFMSRKNAIAAIRGLHHSRTMDGCSAPLVVKFAEAQRDKNAGGGMSRFGTQIGGANRTPLGTGYSGGYGTGFGNAAGGWGNQQQQVQQQQSMNQPPPNMNNPLFNNPQAVNLLQQLSNAASALSALAGGVNQFGMAPQGNQQGGFNNQQNQNNPANALAMMLQAAGNLNQVVGNQQQGGQQYPQAQQPTNTAGSFNTTNAAVNNTATGTGFGQPPPIGGAGAQSLPLAQPANTNTPFGRQVEGPEGCNLFVYHLPEEFTDSDLANMFSPFGNVISAKVFLDKETNQSKGFGFVSYDNPSSAETAIQGMNSFLIGTKRLKVQPKRSTVTKDLAKPY